MLIINRLKFLIYLFVFFILISSVKATIIHGIVYDLSLKRIDDAMVEINTSPRQFLVAKNGTYSFYVPNGVYKIKSQLIQKNTVFASVQENITIKQEGSYVLDLILFPNIEEGIDDIEIDINENIFEAKNYNFLIGFLVFLILFILCIFIPVYHIIKTKKWKRFQLKGEALENSKNYDSEQVIRIIKQESGRTTQKEIRKQIPLSESKISLMITELEHKGLIERIKKGRGNIIILKKK